MLNLSVITPSYNQEEFIERTIQSVLEQSIAPIEYFIFDALSTDNTISILKKYENSLTWFSEKDNGQAHAVNKGLKKVQGDIIGWINSDDIYYPDTFHHVIQFFTKNPNIDIVYGNANHIDANNLVIEAYNTEPWDNERLKEVCFLSQPAVFFRRSVIKQYGYLNETLHYCMDYEYWLRLGIKGAKFAYLPQILAGSRLYQETKTLGQRVAVHAEINTMLHNRLGKTPDIWLSHYAHVVIDSKNIHRENKKLFLLALITLTLYAAIRWNKSISISLQKMLKSWGYTYCSLLIKKGKL